MTSLLPENFPMRRELKGARSPAILALIQSTARELPDEEGTESRSELAIAMTVLESLPENFPMRRELKESTFNHRNTSIS